MAQHDARIPAMSPAERAAFASELRRLQGPSRPLRQRDASATGAKTTLYRYEADTLCYWLR